jgi:hypothetical protein
MSEIFLDALGAHVAAIAHRGRDPDELRDVLERLNKVLYRDLSGDELEFAGARFDSS